jgi:transketolase
MTASHYKLDNVCAIIDNNGLQIDGYCSDVMSIEPIVDKWRAFGWHVIDINGHAMKAILDAFDEAETVKGKPTMLVARTVKGKGVSFFEGKVQYHGITPTPEELKKALKELEENGK